MPDTLSPENYLSQAYHADVQRLTEGQIAALQAHRGRVWSALIPRSAIKAEILPEGVRYLHPTKGYRWVGKRRFAARGVL